MKELEFDARVGGGRINGSLQNTDVMRRSKKVKRSDVGRSERMGGSGVGGRV
jgi:hypothetical protein